ncbi:hypothetical protein KP509_38G026300 [Ceratopteris richardii]|uniref:BTB domain-containing protein n=1 Tax=Ceratopteris richardii TaxID=49495 RepID=A0A8T2Q3F4_CERRI|nr:hypothetical protein KP509_38G026300 [Ceratopteris richardii]
MEDGGREGTHWGTEAEQGRREFARREMYRVQCLDCRQVLSGRRHSFTEYVYCENCCRYKLRRLQAQIDTLRSEALRAAEKEKELKLASQRAAFLSTWSQDSSVSHGDLSLDPWPPFADVALHPCDGPSVLAHRVILAGKSPAFKAMLCNPDLQGEAQLHVPTMITIDIDDMPHEVLRAFVCFFYKGSIDPKVMEEHAKLLYRAAKKYQVELLETLCEEWITKNISDQNALSNLELAKQYDSDVVKDAILHAASSQIDRIPTYAGYQSYVEKNPALLLELYEGSLKMMRQKRRRKDSVGDYHALTPSRLSDCCDSSSGNNANSVS